GLCRQPAAYLLSDERRSRFLLDRRLKSRQYPAHQVGPTIRHAVIVASQRSATKGADVRHMVAQAALRAEPQLNAEALLSVRNVSVRFGGIVALDGVSFDV